MLLRNMQRVWKHSAAAKVYVKGWEPNAREKWVSSRGDYNFMKKVSSYSWHRVGRMYLRSSNPTLQPEHFWLLGETIFMEYSWTSFLPYFTITNTLKNHFGYWIIVYCPGVQEWKKAARILYGITCNLMPCSSAYDVISNVWRRLFYITFMLNKLFSYCVQFFLKVSSSKP